MVKWAVGCGVIVVFVALVLGLAVASGYNGLVALDQAVQAQWGQVENVYQRRADLVPNLVETVKGAAAFEKDTFTAVTEARSRVGQAASAGPNVPNDPAAFARFQQAQDGLSSALSRLMVVVENYPDLKATANFRDLQAQLEGTENRIAVERMRYNETVKALNAYIRGFPGSFFAGLAHVQAAVYYELPQGQAEAPRVDFSPK